jgi:hypothetical protein
LGRAARIVIVAIALCAGCSGFSSSNDADEIARQVEAMPVPPQSLHFDKVKCSFTDDGVLCSGSLASRDGTQHLPRTTFLFHKPVSDGAPLIAVCDQGRFGISPALNIFCAQ